jgi:hypothetical protein
MYRGWGALQFAGGDCLAANGSALNADAGGYSSRYLLLLSSPQPSAPPIE